MNLSRADLIAKLTAAGFPTASASFLAPDQIEGVTFGTVSADFIRRAWNAYVSLLQSDPNARLTMQREIGGGKSITVPSYVAPGAVCRHQAFAFFGFLLLCLMKQAAATPQQNDAYAIAPVYYTATPRAEDGNRDGRHCRILYVNPQGEVAEFEEGDGDPEPMTAGELNSITFSVFV